MKKPFPSDSQENKVEKKDKKIKNEKPSALQFYWSHGFGHMAEECANRVKKKVNAMKEIWNDLDESNVENSDNENSNYIVFVTHVVFANSSYEFVPKNPRTNDELNIRMLTKTSKKLMTNCLKYRLLWRNKM